MSSKKLLSPVKGKAAVDYVIAEHRVTQRQACRALSVHRTAYRYEPVRLPDEEEVRGEIIDLANTYGRVGYRMVTALIRNRGRRINHKQVERIWRKEGLRLPRKQIKKRI